MGFEAAVGYLKRVLETKNDALQQGKRLSWALESSVSVDVDERFDRTDLNAEWHNLVAGGEPDVNQLIGVRTKISWMAGANRDLRTQYGCCADCRPRVAHDQHRTALLQYRWAQNNLQRLLDIVQQRGQALT
jgi:hypothetical protein